ncbi:P-loop containing nucleoside triphosphate hydrolase protein [Ramaria rubella]|nr:P-loop containing nucleoside triphosphate hydrolase protein [Ramaria rubella]
MGFLLPPSASKDAPVVWRGLMVQKAVQQLLFDVDWRQRTGKEEVSSPQHSDDPGSLDILVIDMPPGTGDVQLTLGQLVKVDGTVIVSTPQDVALLDARKGVHMFRKVGVPILGLLVNSAYYRCTSCRDKHYIFGTLESAKQAVNELGLDKEPGLAGRSPIDAILGEIPLVADVSRLGDQGRLGELFIGPLGTHNSLAGGDDLIEVRNTMESVAGRVWSSLSKSTVQS